MRKGIGLKIGLTLIPLLLGSFIILQFFIVGEFKKSSQIQSENNLNLLSHSVFQTVRAAMNLGDRALIEKSLQEAGQMKGIKELKIHQSQSVIDTFGISAKPSTEEAVVAIFKNPTQHSISLDDEKQQVKRLMERDHIDEEYALTIMKNQISSDKKKEMADIVLDNTKESSK